MIGIDPAMVLCFRDEYLKAPGQQTVRDFKVSLIQEWLLEHLDEFTASDQPAREREYHLLAHCTEKSLKPSSGNDWQSIFAHFGLKLVNQTVGCCGMCGSFGHEKANLAVSKKVYATSWEKSLQVLDTESVLATGYSCRAQVRRFSGVKIRHPVQALLKEL